MMSVESDIRHYPISGISLSIGLFTLAGYLINAYLPRQRVKSAWKFKNIACSLLHGLISGIWALYCLLSLPEMAEDVIHKYNTNAYTLVCFSVGYIIYDAVDMVLLHRKRESFELLGHHFVILVAFGIPILFHIYVGYAVVSLLAEINSIFLHCRQLALICRVDKSAPIYRLISVINIGTFIAFRFILFGWMTRWLFVNKDAVPLVSFTIGSVGLAAITVMNIVLFYRLLKSDFFRALPSHNKMEH